MPTRREKGAGRGVKREHDEDDDEDKRRTKGRGKGRKEDTKPKQEGGTEFRKIRTGSTWNGKPFAGTTSATARLGVRSHTRLEHNSGHWHGAASGLIVG